MRVPKFIEPDELPASVEVRTFSGDLVTVRRPEPMTQADRRTAFWLVLAGYVLLFGYAQAVRDYGLVPVDFIDLRPLMLKLAAVVPTCRNRLDCGLLVVMGVATLYVLTRLGCWAFWRLRLMIYAAKVADETQ